MPSLTSLLNLPSFSLVCWVVEFASSLASLGKVV